MVGQILDQVLGDKPSQRSITVDSGRSSNRGPWKTEPIRGASNSTSFDRGNLWKMPSLIRLMGVSAMSV